MKKKDISKTKKKKKEGKYKLVEESKLQKIEFYVTLGVGAAFLVFLVLAVMNTLYIPATLITFALFLFSICYYYIEEESKKRLVYTLFGLGVLLIIIEVVYTLVKIS